MHILNDTPNKFSHTRNFTVTFMNGLLSTDHFHKKLIILNLNKLSINFKKKII